MTRSWRRSRTGLNGLNRFLVGCECNRATLDAITAEGFDVDSLDRRR